MARGRVISAVLTLKDRDFSANAKKATSNTKDLERRVRHTGNSIKDFGRSATSSFKSVALGAASIVSAIGITKALSGAFNMVRGSMDSAFARIDTMEQFANVMGVMLGDTEKANKVLEETRDIVTGTAFGMDVAASAVQGFVTGGMEAADATRVLGSFTDAVAFYTKGTNEELGTVTDALAKMSTRGKVSMDQLGRIIEAGIPAIDIYAEAMGMSTDEVADAISKGKIEAGQFMDIMDEAFANGTEKFPALTGAAKDAGSSWKGTFDNMGAAVTRGVVGIIESIDEMLTSNGLPDMRSMVGEFGSRFENVLGKVSDKVPVLTDKLVGLYEKSKPGIDWIKDTAFPAVKSTFETLYETAKTGISWLKDNIPLVTSVVAGLAGGLAAFKVLTAINKAFKTYQVIMTALRTQTLLQTAAQLGLNTAMLANPLTWVAVGIGVVIAAGVLLWKNWDTVTEKAGKLWAYIKEKFGNLKDSVVGWFGNMAAKGVALWTGFLLLRDKALEMAGGVKTGVLDMKDKVVGWFGDLKDGAVEKFDDIIQAAKDLPGKIGQGIKDFASSAWDSMKELAKGLVDKFKEALGIKSPSTVFFDMAKWIVKGLVNGLSVSNLKDLGKSMFADFVGGAFNTLESIKGFFAGGGSAGSTTLDALVKQIQSRFPGLVVTSTFRPGDPGDHGRGLAVDLSGYGSSGGYKDVAQFASRLPGVTYTIGDNVVYGRKYGDGSMPSWAKGHMNHVHVSFQKGYEQGGRVTSSGSYLVGESGPEIVQLPAQTRVHNKQNSKRMSGDGPTIIIEKLIATGITVDEVINEMVPKLKLRLANM